METYMGRRTELIWANQGKMDVGQLMQEHYHPCYQLYYILRGNATFVVDGRFMQVKPGTCFIVPAMVPHRMLPLKDDILHSYEVKLQVKDPFLLHRLQSVTKSIEDSGVIRQMLTYVVDNWNCRDEQNLQDIEYMLSTILLNFLIEDLHYENRDSTHIITTDYSAVTRAILVYIEKYFPYKFSLDVMGERLNYNKNYLCSVFGKNTGVSIVDYLNFIRIRQAVIFFAFYGQDVNTTCESVGFSNLSHFSRTFKALTGIAPRDFRRAFSMMGREEAAAYFANEVILNYQLCTMEEAFASLQRMGQLAGSILQVSKR